MDLGTAAVFAFAGPLAHCSASSGRPGAASPEPGLDGLTAISALGRRSTPAPAIRLVSAPLLEPAAQAVCSALFLAARRRMPPPRVAGPPTHRCARIWMPTLAECCGVQFLLTTAARMAWTTAPSVVCLWLHASTEYTPAAGHLPAQLCQAQRRTLWGEALLLTSTACRT